jgi:hypothetical protein
MAPKCVTVPAYGDRFDGRMVGWVTGKIPGSSKSHLSAVWTIWTPP